MSDFEGKILRPGFYLTIEAQYSAFESQLTGFDMGIYNNTLQEADVNIELSFDSIESEIFDLEMEPNDWLAFTEMNLEQFNDVPHFDLLLNWKNSSKKVRKKIKPKAKHISKPAELIAQLETKAYYFEIWQPEILKPRPKKLEKPIGKIDPDMIKESLLGSFSSAEKIDIEKGHEAIDIHADKMGLTQVDISNGVLEYQLSAFETALDRAIANGLHELLVIHGRGAGVLRKEVHRRLKEHHMVHSFLLCNDGGATLVSI